MKYTEEAISFLCADDGLIGILTKPEAPASIGILVIVGGPQYRAGSHRQFVLLSRSVAAAGYAVLRFDCRGMGDSTGQQQTFTNATADIAAAINAFQKQLPAVTSVVLWGLCDGASSALLYRLKTNDSRVSGLCLLNPWVRSTASLARTQVKHYYARRLMEREFWGKLISGKVALNALAGLMENIRLMRATPVPSTTSHLPFQQGMALAWGQFDGQILLLLSGEDYTAKEFLEYVSVDTAWSKALAHPHLTRHDIPGADHTFSDKAHSARVEELTIDWLEHIVSKTT